VVDVPRKTCIKCLVEKDLSEFPLSKCNKDGHKGSCRECCNKHTKEYKREYYKIPENRERRRIMNKRNKDLRKDTPEYKAMEKRWNKKHYEKNKEVLNANKKIYVEKNRARRREYVREWKKYKYHNDINFKLADLLRERIRAVLKGKTKKGSAVADLGCSFDFFRSYIESKFKQGMTWNNLGRGCNGKGMQEWQLDHIRPLALFNLEDREEFLKAVNYTNLQPLWATENLKKGKKLEKVHD
jgi:hypothetical protein